MAKAWEGRVQRREGQWEKNNKTKGTSVIHSTTKISLNNNNNN